MLEHHLERRSRQAAEIPPALGAIECHHSAADRPTARPHAHPTAVNRAVDHASRSPAPCRAARHRPRDTGTRERKKGDWISLSIALHLRVRSEAAPPEIDRD